MASQTRAPEWLVDVIMRARTPEEVVAAERAADAYLAENPDDTHVRIACEQLERVKQSYRSGAPDG